MEVAPSSDFFGVGPGQSLGKLLSAAVRAQKKNRRGGKQTDVKIGDRFLDINGFLKENDVQKMIVSLQWQPHFCNLRNVAD